MRAKREWRLYGVAAAAALLMSQLPGAAAFAAGTQGGGADGYNIGSLASPFLQSKTQITILGQDDQKVPGCQQKQFVKAAPAEAPTVRSLGSVTEKKWREMWTLDRCGEQVNYWVFFTEVGNGGAYYAIVGP